MQRKVLSGVVLTIAAMAGAASAQTVSSYNVVSNGQLTNSYDNNIYQLNVAPFDASFNGGTLNPVGWNVYGTGSNGTVVHSYGVTSSGSSNRQFGMSKETGADSTASAGTEINNAFTFAGDAVRLGGGTGPYGFYQTFNTTPGHLYFLYSGFNPNSSVVTGQNSSMEFGLENAASGSSTPTLYASSNSVAGVAPSGTNPMTVAQNVGGNRNLGRRAAWNATIATGNHMIARIGVRPTAGGLGGAVGGGTNLVYDGVRVVDFDVSTPYTSLQNPGFETSTFDARTDATTGWGADTVTADSTGRSVNIWDGWAPLGGNAADTGGLLWNQAGNPAGATPTKSAALDNFNGRGRQYQMQRLDVGGIGSKYTLGGDMRLFATTGTAIVDADARIGIDPTGGTDPTSGSVIWSNQANTTTWASYLLAEQTDTTGNGVTIYVAAGYNGTNAFAAQAAGLFDNITMSTVPTQSKLYWDINSTTAGSGGASPSGAWDNATANFNNDSTGAGPAAGLTKNTSTLDIVNFSAGGDATGTFTVTLSGPAKSVAGVEVEEGNVTLSGGTIGSSGAYNISTGATANITGAVTGAVTKTGGGTLNLTNNNNFTGGTNVQAGKLVVNRLQENNAVSISGNGTVQVRESSPDLASGHPSGNNAFVSRPSSLSIANDAGPILSRTYTGTLDLGNNDLILDYTGASPIQDVEDMVRAGYNGGDWLGKGITSSTAASLDAFGAYVLAVADNAELIVKFGDGSNVGPGGGPLFSGQIVDDTTILIKFTHHSDIDLNGVVNVNDSVIFNGNYSEGDFAKWSTGDQNYDGVYNVNDSVLFNGSYDESLMSLPEPGSLSLLGLAGLGLVRRRRRQQA